MLTVQDVAAGVGGLLLHPVANAGAGRAFRAVAVDSRAVTEGALFVALPGERTDGHRFIAGAIRNGASGVLAKAWPADLPSGLRERATLFAVNEPLTALQDLAAYWRGRFPIPAIAVTGSVGKTSTKEAIAHLLCARYNVLQSTGNLNTEIGLPMVLLRLEPEHDRMVLEMGMHHAGDIALLCKLAQPQVGVVTNVGPTHLERMGDIQRIAEAKAELPASLPRTGTAILNADDPLVRGMAACTQASVVTYGTDAGADCRATDIRTYGLDGIAFTLAWQGEQRAVRTPMIGRHNVYTALSAAAVALGQGFSLAEACDGLAGLPDSARVTVRHTRNGALVLDDTYNASPASMKAALDLLADVPGRRVAVLADMLELGTFEEEGHRQVGCYAAQRAQALHAIGPRCRAMADAAAGSGRCAVEYHATKAGALAALQRADVPGTVFLFKGSRGMALEELVGAMCGS